MKANQLAAIITRSVLLLTATAIFASISFAQQAAQERDPFFPEGPRTRGTASSSPDSWGRDPFSRPFEGITPLSQAPAARVRGKNLIGIIYSPEVRLAIIGGESLREGGMVGDQKLVDIRRRSVVLMNSAGETEELFLEDFSIRK